MLHTKLFGEEKKVQLERFEESIIDVKYKLVPDTSKEKSLGEDAQTPIEIPDYDAQIGTPASRYQISVQGKAL